MSERKKADPDHEVHELISRRWSPYVFDGRPVSEEDLLAVFEAARWAPSSYNEQPWRFLVATRDDEEEFERALSCLVEANRAWAKDAPVLALTAVSLEFARNGKPNKTAHHDLGLAVASLSLEATARGLSVHQMAGLDPERARRLYGIPERFEVLTAFALGYAGTPAGELGKRDRTRRDRKPLSELVFSGAFGSPLAA